MTYLLDPLAAVRSLKVRDCLTGCNIMVATAALCGTKIIHTCILVYLVGGDLAGWKTLSSGWTTGYRMGA
jgi:hypothetical protein